MQHGDAVSREVDPDRPLSSDGWCDVNRMAEYLAEKDVLIQRIIHSGKLRAEQTAKIISDKLDPDIKPEAIGGISPNDDPEKFIEALSVVEGAVLVVSHMPFVSTLCSALLCGNSGALFGFSPGTIVCLDYAQGEWSLSCMIHPDNL